MVGKGLDWKKTTKTEVIDLRKSCNFIAYNFFIRSHFNFEIFDSQDFIVLIPKEPIYGL